MNQLDSAAVFAAVFVTLYVGHSVGDHWVQSSCQAATKGLPGWTGRLACARHVVGLTVTKGVVLTPAVLLLHLPVTTLGLVLGLGVDALSHYWADRRTTLKRLADRCGRAEFYSLGTPTHAGHPVTAKGAYAPTIGTGAYALDQSWHTLCLFIAALLIAVV
ncbi:transcriptional regulator [Streptomyces sp. NPDC004579]|uniref:transcriptional regulator n=1 Tax=Streptomyces sp. NPDC004579 TaxID=3154667 RepID=UPI0033B75236